MPINILSRTATVAALLAAMLRWDVAVAETNVFGPPHVHHWRALAAQWGVKSGEGLEGYLKSYPYNIAVNLLIDGAFQSHGTKWCLPPPAMTRPLGRVYFELLVPELDAAIDAASVDDLVMKVVVDCFAKKFPCSET